MAYILAATDKYSKIINLPHHVSSKHAPMPMIERAAQFAPFAALTGYDSEIKEKARFVDKKISLSEEVLTELNVKFQIIKECISSEPELNFIVFEPDMRKSGGKYLTISGTVKKIDEIERKIILKDGTKIAINNILDITGEIFQQNQFEI
jgi:hypothetical protein